MTEKQAADGKIYQVEHYDLDVVISVGYRVKSAEGIHFRRWANDALKRYVLAGYLPGLTLLRDYDAGQLEAPPGTVPGWGLTIGEARSVIAQVGAKFSDDALFGRERGGALDGVVASIYQGFGGEQLYPTVQQKAANLLYLVVKDHPLRPAS